MDCTSLHCFVARILADDRILFGDLKRLQRDILPASITTRQEAEILLFLDSAVHRADREWTVYLTATVRDFTIWGLHPAGAMDREKAEWLAAALSCTDPTKTARVIIREIVHEARKIDDDALRQLKLAARAAGIKPASKWSTALPGRLNAEATAGRSWDVSKSNASGGPAILPALPAVAQWLQG